MGGKTRNTSRVLISFSSPDAVAKVTKVWLVCSTSFASSCCFASYCCWYSAIRRSISARAAATSPPLPAFELEGPPLQARLLDAVVDRADLVLLDLAQGGAVACGAVHQRDQTLPGRRRAFGDHLVSALQAHRRAHQRPVLAPLDPGDVPRRLAGRDLVLVDPLEVEPEEVAVADLELQALPLVVLRRSRARAPAPRATTCPAKTDPSRRVSFSTGAGQKKPRPLVRITTTSPTIIRRHVPRADPVSQIHGSPGPNTTPRFGRAASCGLGAAPGTRAVPPPATMAAPSGTASGPGSRGGVVIRAPGTARAGAGGSPPRSC